MSTRRSTGGAHAVFYGASPLGWKWLTAVVAAFVWAGILRSAIRYPGIGLKHAFLGVVLVVGPAVAYGLVRRSMWIYDDRSARIRGAWYSADISAEDVTAVTLVPTGAREGNRVYVTFRHPNGSLRAVCIASSISKRPATQTARGLVAVLATHGGSRTVELTQGYLPPAEVKGGWRLGMATKLR